MEKYYPWSRRQKEKRMTPPQMGGEYNPLTGETEPPHYDHNAPHEPLQRDFTSPLGQGSPGRHLKSTLFWLPGPKMDSRPCLANATITASSVTSKSTEPPSLLAAP